MTDTVDLRHDWSLEEIEDLLTLPLMDLLWRAQGVHRAANPGYRVQLASLLSVKTGGCEEDCAYCPQSMHHSSDVPPAGSGSESRARSRRVAPMEPIVSAWVGPGGRSEGPAFESMLKMVRGAGLGLEACVTAGMLTDDQAERLAEAG